MHLQIYVQCIFSELYLLLMCLIFRVHTPPPLPNNFKIPKTIFLKKNVNVFVTNLFSFKVTELDFLKKFLVIEKHAEVDKVA